MKLEDQVCSLELAKRLKELGARQEGYFKWVCFGSKTSEPHWKLMPAEWGVCADEFSAFTFPELWEELPHRLEADNLTSFLVIKKVEQNDDTIRTILNYEMISGTIHPWCQNEENPANACAKMLIHLLETKPLSL